MYKLLAVDMDGTLLRDNKTISCTTLKAIQDAKNHGVKIVLSSGRYLNGIREYLKQLDILNEEEYAITLNGALIQETKSGKVLYDSPLSHDDVNYIYSIGNSLNLNVELVSPDYFVINKVTQLFEVDSKINNIRFRIMDMNTIPKDLEILKVMFVNSGKVLDATPKKLPEEIFERFSVVRSGTNFLEFLNKGTSKGTAIKILADKLNIKSEEIICIGDAENDINMIKYAGLGVAMANAYPHVKEIADYITKSNEEDGVAHVINKFILSKNAS